MWGGLCCFNVLLSSQNEVQHRGRGVGCHRIVGIALIRQLEFASTGKELDEAVFTTVGVRDQMLLKDTIDEAGHSVPILDLDALVIGSRGLGLKRVVKADSREMEGGRRDGKSRRSNG